METPTAVYVLVTCSGAFRNKAGTVPIFMSKEWLYYLFATNVIHGINGLYQLLSLFFLLGYIPQAYLLTCQSSKMESFCKIRKRLKVFYYIDKKSCFQPVDRFLNTEVKYGRLCSCFYRDMFPSFPIFCRRHSLMNQLSYNNFLQLCNTATTKT